MAPGKRPGALRKVGMHGDDTRYASTVKSKSRFRIGTRYTVRLQVPGQNDDRPPGQADRRPLMGPVRVQTPAAR